MTGKDKGSTPRRSARNPAPAPKPPLTFLGAFDRMLADDGRARNLRRLVYTLTVGVALLLCLAGFVLIHVAAPVGITALSTAGTVVGTVAGIAARTIAKGRRDKGRTDPDPPENEAG